MVDFSKNPMYEPSFNFCDQNLLDSVEKGDRHCWLFFRLLALCHTVMPEVKDGRKRNTPPPPVPSHLNLWCILKPLYTFGKQYCPSPTLRVSQLIYKTTNL